MASDLQTLAGRSGRTVGSRRSGCALDRADVSPFIGVLPDPAVPGIQRNPEIPPSLAGRQISRRRDRAFNQEAGARRPLRSPRPALLINFNTGAFGSNPDFVRLRVDRNRRRRWNRNYDVLHSLIKFIDPF